MPDWTDWLLATDDSVWQSPDVDYAKVAGAGVRLVWHRAGYGDDQHPRAAHFEFGKDSLYDLHRQHSAPHVQRGAYFFPVPAASSSKASADAFFRYVGDDWMDLQPMVDMENPPGTNQAALVGYGALLDQMLDLGQRITIESGRRPIAYGGGWVSSYGLQNDRRLAEVYDGQWVANYGSQDDYETEHRPDYRPTWWPAVHPAWDALLIFQHSGDNGRCPGYPGGVDIDLVHPTMTALKTPKEWDEMASQDDIRKIAREEAQIAARPQVWCDADDGRCYQVFGFEATYVPTTDELSWLVKARGCLFVSNVPHLQVKTLRNYEDLIVKLEDVDDPATTIILPPAVRTEIENAPSQDLVGEIVDRLNV